MSVCPFCGKSLICDNRVKTFESMEILLISVRNEYGIEVFENVPKVKGILKDQAPELKSDIKLFSRALDSSAFKGYRLQVGDSSLLPKLQKSKFILMDEEFMSRENADKVIDWFCVLLDLPTVSSEREEAARRDREEEERHKREEEEERRKREAEVRRNREEVARRNREAEARRKREEEEARRRREEEERRKKEEQEEALRKLEEETRLELQRKKEEQKKSESTGFGCFFGVISFLFGGTMIIFFIWALATGFDFSELQILPLVVVIAITVLAIMGVSNLDKWTKNKKIAVTVIIILLIGSGFVNNYMNEQGISPFGSAKDSIKVEEKHDYYSDVAVIKNAKQEKWVYASLNELKSGKEDIGADYYLLSDCIITDVATYNDQKIVQGVSILYLHIAGDKEYTRSVCCHSDALLSKALSLKESGHKADIICDIEDWSTTDGKEDNLLTALAIDEKKEK